jgi:hypothetical protein
MSFADFFLCYVILKVGLAYRLSDLIACTFFGVKRDGEDIFLLTE